MKKSNGKQVIQKLFDYADVQINGDRPWDIQIHNPSFFERVLAGGSLALGESYMDGWWDCDALDQFFDKILSEKLDKRVKKTTGVLWAFLKAKIINAQRKSKAHVIGKRHYDIGNSLFSIMLDKRMNYSCAYWHEAMTLDDAQEAKLELICQKMGLKPGMKVLDIGCGWGGFAKYAAEKYDAKVTGVTVSHEQVEYAGKDCRGLDVDIKLQDYRDLKETFDRIISIGMFEHVGFRNYKAYMKVVHRCLEANGLFLLHTIAGNSSVNSTDQWINKYIFPNSMLPSAKQITTAAEGLFVLEDWHSFGQYYDNTLNYLLSCAGSFRARRNQLWQIVFSKQGVRGGYQDRV
jgi:cyclopropane-fatty-acyl-phospholipid synthase